MENTPSVARVTHVEGIILKEPAFNGLLGTKDTPLKRRDGEMVNFYKHSVGIAQVIHNAGLDAISLPKAKILEYASAYFAEKGGPAVPASVAAAPAVAPAPAPAAQVATTAAVQPAAAPKGAAAAAGKNYGLAIFSLVGAAIELAKLDMTAGSKDRRDKLQGAFEAYRSQTSVA